MDKLDAIFALQKALNDEIREKRDLQYSSEEWIQKETLAMVSELAEVLDEVNFKWWKNPKEVQPELVKGEIVDLLHFLISMCLDAGMDGEELYRLYTEKHKENLARQHGTSTKKGYAVNETAEGETK